MTLIILSSPTTTGLTKEAEKYDIHQVGSLSISNGHYFIVILGELKEEAPAQLELSLDTPIKSSAKRIAKG
jgi:hypothetical protein